MGRTESVDYVHGVASWQVCTDAGRRRACGHPFSRRAHADHRRAPDPGRPRSLSQRVVELLADGAPAESIVAFTFTERAASELKERIGERVEERLGAAALDRLNGLFVGTIHAYCFRLAPAARRRDMRPTTSSTRTS